MKHSDIDHTVCDFLKAHGWSFGWVYVEDECWKVDAVKGETRLVAKDRVLVDALSKIRDAVLALN